MCNKKKTCEIVVKISWTELGAVNYLNKNYVIKKNMWNCKNFLNFTIFGKI